MAAKKKIAKKKTTNSRDVDSLEKETKLWVLILGWFAVFIGVVLLLGSICSVYRGTEENILGPYLGKMFPDMLAFCFGRFPVILFLITIVMWGFFIAIQSLREKFLRPVLGMTLLTLDFSFILSLKYYDIVQTSGASQLSRDALANNGGIIGQFFCKNIAIPFFGVESRIAPMCILLFVMVLIFVVSFGLRPKHFASLMELVRYIKNTIVKKKEVENENEEEIENTPKHRGISMDGDTTIFNTPNTYRIKHKGVLKPFNAKKNWMEQTVNTSIENTEVFTTMPGFPGEGEKTQVVRESLQSEDPEILRLERELKENGPAMGALQIKEIHDKIAEIRRARDLLNWEHAHQNKIVVKGAVRGNESDESFTTDEDKTVAFNQNDKSVNYEDSIENDETFIPQIVTSDEVDQDPSYNPPNIIGTSDASETSTASGCTGVPQPDPSLHYDDYVIPQVEEILSEHEIQSADYTEEELNQIGKMLEEKLENFKVKGKVVGCETGPVITRFEVEPGPGVKVSQFSSLQDDLAMALKATSIRILTPIPGKGAVGIEIPNRKTQTIYGRDIFESDAFKPNSDKIVMALGKDISGEPFTMDLAKAPHLMIAGQTGSGKSVCINALMASMLFSKTPDELRMILVDPKAVELKMYENIPHLLAPVITKPEIAIQALQWLCFEMDRRTEVLAKAKVRNLLGFNEKFDAGDLPEEVPEEDRNHRMAFIVVIIDEMADLMMVAGKEIEKSVSRLAAKARAVGIHLVLATQRPSVKVITGNIKANLPTRISFKVASQVDARTIMDHAGAEKLLGRGDMLFKAVNAPDPVRVHGAFLSDEEAENLADACSNQNVCYPQLATFEVEGVSEEGSYEEAPQGGGKLDKLLFDVAKWVIEQGNGVSTSSVQRYFSIGYARAGRIVDQMASLGICGKPTGNSKPRAVLIDMDGLMNLELSGRLK